MPRCVRYISASFLATACVHEIDRVHGPGPVPTVSRVKEMQASSERHACAHSSSVALIALFGSARARHARLPFTLKWSSAAAWNGDVIRLPFLSHRHRRSSNWPRSATPIVDDVNVVSVLGYQPHVCESLIRVCPGASHLTEKQSHVCQYLRGGSG